MKLVIVLCLVTLSVAKKTQWVSENDIPELGYLDTSIDPCDNFYQYTCGNFKQFHQRAEDEEILDAFTLTEDELVKIGNEILASPKHPDDPVALKRMKSAYKACTDDYVAEHLPRPELQLIQEFGGMPMNDSKDTNFSWNDIAEIVGRTGIQQMFQLRIENFNPDDYFLLLYTDSWKIPDMVRPKYTKTYDEVLEESLKMAAKKVSSKVSTNDALDTFLWKISDHLIDGANPQKISKDISDVRDFITKLFSGGIPVAAFQSNVTTTWAGYLSQLQNLTDHHFDDHQMKWVDFLNIILRWANVEVTEDTLIYVYDINMVYGILNLVRQTDPKIVKNFVLLRTFLYLAPDSDPTTRQAFEEYYKTQGKKFYERWEYCTRKLLDLTDTTSLSFAVSYAYERYYFNTNKIKKAVDLIKEMKTAFKTLLNTSDWLDASRDDLIHKVDNIVVSLAYPDLVEKEKSLNGFYENVRVCDWDNYNNSLKIRAFKQAYALSEYINHDYWKSSPFEVNAYALKPNKALMMPLSMLSDTFFYGENPIVDYSRLGTIIAHELTHHFDTGGINYNANAYSDRNWLSNATKEAFKEKVQCMKDQYSKYYVPEIDEYVDGSSSIDENLSDNSGIRRSYLAYEEQVQKQTIRNSSKKYTLEQLFFLGYGTMWCADESLDFLRYLVDSNQHPPSRIRVLGTLSNFKEFSEAFNCPVGSTMNPEDKCVIW